MLDAIIIQALQNVDSQNAAENADKLAPLDDLNRLFHAVHILDAFEVIDEQDAAQIVVQIHAIKEAIDLLASVDMPFTFMDIAPTMDRRIASYLESVYEDFPELKEAINVIKRHEIESACNK